MRSTAGPIRRPTRRSIGQLLRGIQDFGLALRYNILDLGLTVTPVIAATIPSHYRTMGEAAPGQDGFAAHRRECGPAARSRCCRTRTSTGRSAFVQPLRGIPLDRQRAELEVGSGSPRRSKSARSATG